MGIDEQQWLQYQTFITYFTILFIRADCSYVFVVTNRYDVSTAVHASTVYTFDIKTANIIYKKT